MLKRHNPATVVEAFGGGYSQALEIPPGARLMFTAGQWAWRLTARRRTASPPRPTRPGPTSWRCSPRRHGRRGYRQNHRLHRGPRQLPGLRSGAEESARWNPPGVDRDHRARLALPEWLVEIEAVAAKVD